MHPTFPVKKTKYHRLTMAKYDAKWATSASDSVFWSYIFVDHIEYILIALDQGKSAKVQKLRAEGTQLLDRWQRIHEAANQHQKGKLTTQDLCELKTWKLAVLHQVATEWCGFIRPSMLHEMIREVEYYVARQDKQLNYSDVVGFYSNDAQSHAALFEADVDPSEKQAKETFHALCEGLTDLRAELGLDTGKIAVQARLKLQDLAPQQRDSPACRRFLALTGMEDSPLHEKTLLSVLSEATVRSFGDSTSNKIEKLVSAENSYLMGKNPVLSIVHPDIIQHVMLESHRGLKDMRGGK